MKYRYIYVCNNCGTFFVENGSICTNCGSSNVEEMYRWEFDSYLSKEQIDKLIEHIGLKVLLCEYLYTLDHNELVELLNEVKGG
jgi:hypothetical protein